MEETKTESTTSAQTNGSEKPYNLEPNVEAALAYVLGALSGIIVFLLEKNNKFVRFHAVQSIVTNLAFFIVGIVAGFVPIIGWIIAALLPLGSILLFLFLAFQAYNKKEFEVPVLGKIAKDFVNKQ